MTNLLDAALAFEAAGCSVVPARPDGSKAPAGSWKAHQKRRPGPAEIRAQLDGTTFDGFGVICGAISGNLEMLEWEGRALAEGLYAQVEHLADAAGLGDLWQRVTTGYRELTPGAGFHLLYRVDGPVAGNTKLAQRPATEAELAADPQDKVKVLIETRGEGGYVIVAPSAGRTHPSGSAWVVVEGGPASIPTISQAERDQLHLLARMLDQMPAAVLPDDPARAPRVRADGPLSPGDDYNDRATWQEILEPHGWARVYVHGGVTYWRRPGKSQGVSATTGRNDGDNLYVFSSSTVFEQEAPYSKFGAVALLEHGGDYSAAAGALRRAGYGGERDNVVPLTPLHEMIVAPPAVNGPLALDPAVEAATEPGETDEAEQHPQSWRPVDLTAYLDGTYVPEEPALLPRADGMHLLYAGRVHSFHGESESGKSMLAQAEAARLVREGTDVLYVDFESDAAAVTARLRDLGADAAAQLAHLVYVRPEGSPYALSEIEAWRDLLGRRYRLAVLDGVTDALSTFGTKSSSDNDEITTWMRAVPRAVARHTGAAVVLVDHVTKDAETRGRFAVGGQAKMNGLDGAAYVVEVVEPLGRGLRGVLTMRVAKDRPGSVRPVCGPFRKGDRTQEATRVVIDSTGGEGIVVTFGEPASHVGDSAAPGGDDFRPTGLMERVSRVLEDAPEAMTLRELIDRIKSSGTKARDTTLRDAVKRLVDEGYLVRDKAGQSHLHTSRQPYRQTADPTSDAYVEPVENLIADPTVSRVPTVSDRVREPVPETVSRPSSPYGDGTRTDGAGSDPTVSRETHSPDPVDSEPEVIACRRCGEAMSEAANLANRGICWDCA